uniref:Uncharacterized protein n=1 Tax=Strongyloides venezuelensis TaxID=75913 RepID=A0A0K0FIT7_STRVS
MFHLLFLERDYRLEVFKSFSSQLRDIFKIMNSLCVVILIGILINISFGYKTNCEAALPLSCTFFLTPDDEAYQNTLLGSLKSRHKDTNNLGLDKNESDESKIEEVNKKLQTALDDDTINDFLKNVYGFGKRGYGGVRIVLVSNSIYNYLQSDYTTSKPATSLPLKDPYVKHKSLLDNNIFKKIGKKVLNHKSY